MEGGIEMTNNDAENEEEEIKEGAWAYSADTPATDIVHGTASASGSMRPWEEEQMVEVVQTLEKLSLTSIRVHCDLEKGADLEIIREPTVIKTVVKKKRR